jgi:hypothetical protein
MLISKLRGINSHSKDLEMNHRVLIKEIEITGHFQCPVIDTVGDGSVVGYCVASGLVTPETSPPISNKM